MNIKEELIREIHSPARRNFPKARVILKGAINDLWQADLVDMTKYQDRGFKYILTVIDCACKKAWGIPLKRKTQEQVADGIESVFKEAGPPKLLQTDKGREFFNAHFARMIKKYNVKHYSTYSPLKASIVERFNRTLKERMWIHFNLIGSYKWVDHIPRILRDYNSTVHSSTRMRPIDVTRKHESEILRRLALQRVLKKTKPKYKVGQWVRISKFKNLFEKGYLPNWSNELFKIKQVINRGPPMYTLIDSDNKPILGLFYEFEIKPTRYPGYYLVEKVIRRKNQRAFVKYLGLDSSHNSWIPIKNLL